MPHVVADRAALMRATSANLEPLLLTYRGDGATAATTTVVERTAERPPLLSTTTEDGVGHRLWSVTDPTDLDRVRSELARQQALIADGHHRWATYRTLRAEHPSPSPWDYGLVLLVDTARYPLRVRAIHRLLHDLPVANAVAALDGRFRVRRLDTPLSEALEALAEASGDGNAYLLAGDGAFHLVDRPDPELLARTVPRTARRRGGPWTRPSCTPRSSRRSGGSPRTRRPTCRTSTTRRPRWRRPSATAARRS